MTEIDLRLYGAAELARLSGLGENGIRDAIRSGELRTVRVGSGTKKVQRRATLREFQAWMEGRTQAPPATGDSPPAPVKPRRRRPAKDTQDLSAITEAAVAKSVEWKAPSA